jgi:hypothetical protein
MTTTNELTKQEPTKRVFSDWVLTFEEWKSEGLQPDHIRDAWTQSNDDRKGFHVGRPGALTTVAVSIKSKSTAKPSGVRINAQAVQQTQQMISEKWDDMKFVPRPADCPKPRISGATK